MHSLILRTISRWWIPVVTIEFISESRYVFKDCLFGSGTFGIVTLTTILLELQRCIFKSNDQLKYARYVFVLQYWIRYWIQNACKKRLPSSEERNILRIAIHTVNVTYNLRHCSFNTIERIMVRMLCVCIERHLLGLGLLSYNRLMRIPFSTYLFLAGFPKCMFWVFYCDLSIRH